MIRGICRFDGRGVRLGGSWDYWRICWLVLQRGAHRSRVTFMRQINKPVLYVLEFPPNEIILVQDCEFFFYLMTIPFLTDPCKVPCSWV
jgi:hypothetical protein